MFQFYHLGKCKFPFDRLKNRKKNIENLSIIGMWDEIDVELSQLLVYFFMMFRYDTAERRKKIIKSVERNLYENHSENYSKTFRPCLKSLYSSIYRIRCRRLFEEKINIFMWVFPRFSDQIEK